MVRTLVAGGGFGGLAAVAELRSRLPAGHSVTLVDRRDQFFMGLAKLWDLVGMRPLEAGTRPLDGVARDGVEVLRAEITAIQPVDRRLLTTQGSLDADHLLVALGASFDPVQLGWLRPPAHNLYDASALPAIRHALEELESGRIVVGILGVPYKCPPAPYEASMLLDEWLRARGRRNSVAITVFTPQPSALPVAGPKASRQLGAAIEERDIELLTQRAASGIDAGRGEVTFANADTVRFDLLLAVPRHVPPSVVAQSGLAGASGWIEPDPRTLETPFDGVYAVGDCTQVPIAEGEAQLPKAGVFAEAEARVAAANIAAEITGGATLEFDGRGYCFVEFGGRRAAYVQGDFFAEPAPRVELSSPSEETFLAKQAFERTRLDSWL